MDRSYTMKQIESYFSKRSGFEQSENRQAQALQEVQKNTHSIIDLTLSNPTLAGVSYPEEAIFASLQRSDALRYQPDPRGLLSAREAIDGYMKSQGVDADPERILLTSSTSEAYTFLFKLLCDPGDEVMVPQPSYPLIEYLARLESIRPVPYPLLYDGQWYICMDLLREGIGPRTKAIIVVSPNNPTGSYLKRSELESLAAIGIPIISDEVFSTYSLADDPHRVDSALDNQETLVFSLFGLSKLMGLPQMKLSWICYDGPKELQQEVGRRLQLISDLFLSVGTPIQLVLPRLFEMYKETAEAIRRRIYRNLNQLQQSIPSMVDLYPVEGGWYAILKLPTVQSDEKWALDFLIRDKVQVYPGFFYDIFDKSHIVISLLTPESDFDQGIGRILRRVIRQLE